MIDWTLYTGFDHEDQLIYESLEETFGKMAFFQVGYTAYKKQLPTYGQTSSSC